MKNINKKGGDHDGIKMGETTSLDSTLACIPSLIRG